MTTISCPVSSALLLLGFPDDPKLTKSQSKNIYHQALKLNIVYLIHNKALTGFSSHTENPGNPVSYIWHSVKYFSR